MSETTFPDEAIDALAEALWAKIVGTHFDPIEFNLRAKLALETRLLGSASIPFGLDKMSTDETACYIGVQPETLRDRTKRKQLGIPEPYSFARKLHWRRSEIDPWVETQREFCYQAGGALVNIDELEPLKFMIEYGKMRTGRSCGDCSMCCKLLPIEETELLKNELDIIMSWIS